MHPILENFSIFTWHLILDSEDTALKFLEDVGVIPTPFPTPPCPMCKAKTIPVKRPETKIRWRWVCPYRNSKKCNGYVNPAKNTILHRLRLPINELLAAMFGFIFKIPIVKHTKSLNAWRRHLGLKVWSTSTMNLLYNECREISEIVSSHYIKQLGAEGKTICLSESEFVKRNYYDGDKTKTVVGAYCEENTEGLILLIDKEVPRKNWRKLVRRHCQSGSQVTCVKKHLDQSTKASMYRQQPMLHNFYRRVRLVGPSDGKVLEQFMEDIKLVYPGHGVKGLSLLELNANSTEDDILAQFLLEDKLWALPEVTTAQSDNTNEDVTENSMAHSQQHNFFTSGSQIQRTPSVNRKNEKDVPVSTVPTSLSQTQNSLSGGNQVPLAPHLSGVNNKDVPVSTVTTSLPQTQNPLSIATAQKSLVNSKFISQPRSSVPPGKQVHFVPQLNNGTNISNMPPVSAIVASFDQISRSGDIRRIISSTLLRKPVQISPRLKSKRNIPISTAVSSLPQSQKSSSAEVTTNHGVAQSLSNTNRNKPVPNLLVEQSISPDTKAVFFDQKLYKVTRLSTKDSSTKDSIQPELNENQISEIDNRMSSDDDSRQEFPKADSLLLDPIQSKLSENEISDQMDHEMSNDDNSRQELPETDSLLLDSCTKDSIQSKLSENEISDQIDHGMSIDDDSRQELPETDSLLLGENIHTGDESNNIMIHDVRTLSVCSDRSGSPEIEHYSPPEKRPRLEVELDNSILVHDIFDIDNVAVYTDIYDEEYISDAE